RYPGTIGYDIDAERVKALRNGEDWTREIPADRLRRAGLVATSKLADLEGADVFIVCVPTPIHSDRRPDLGPLQSASRTVGKVIKPGGIVCFESTVYPGVTEEVCGPIIAEVSGLKCGVDFSLGYSPERINPGDTEHTFERIVKIVSADNPAAL